MHRNNQVNYRRRRCDDDRAAAREVLFCSHVRESAYRLFVTTAWTLAVAVPTVTTNVRNENGRLVKSIMVVWSVCLSRSNS